MGFSVEIDLRKKKCMFSFSYNIQNSSVTTHMESIGKVIDSRSAEYENFILSVT